jgi:hypothetical protein
MSSAHIRIRRLSRLAARARAELRTAEWSLAGATREAAEAKRRTASITTILTESRASVGDRQADLLLAGANLRQLLAPAAAAAEAAETRMADDLAKAGLEMKAASARADSLADRLTDARRLAAAETERRSADLTPPARKRT